MFWAQHGYRWVVALVLATTTLGVAAEEVPPEQDPKLLRLVDPVLHWDRTPVAPEDNAWPVMAEVIEARTDLDQAKVMAWLPEKMYPDSAPLTQADRERAQTMIESNREVLALLLDAAKRPVCEIPDDALEDMADLIRDLGQLRAVCNLSILQSQFDIEAGEHGAAIERLLDLHRIGTLMGRSDGKLAMLTTGMALVTNVDWVLAALIESGALPAEQRQQIVAYLSAMPAKPGIADMIRRAFWRSYAGELRFMCELEEAGHPSKALSWMNELMETSRRRRPRIPDEAGTGGLDRWCAAHGVTLIDLEQTIAMTREHCGRIVRNELGPWLDQDTLIDEDYEALAESIRSDVAYSVAMLERIDEEAAPNGRVDFDVDIERLRNAMGKMSVISRIPALHLATDISRMINCWDAALLGIAAISLSPVEVGSLHDLVRLGILKRPPADPFGMERLQYDAGRRLVWSVGKDRRDDGGKGFPDDPKKQLLGDDYVWRVRSGGD